MKIKFNINKLIPVLFISTALSFSSCLKSNDTYNDFTKVGTTIELPLAALNQETNVKVVAKSYTANPTPSDLPVVVNIASPKTLDKDLTVTLAVNANDALNKFNAANGTTYILLPSTAYSVADLKVTIPAGQRIGTITFKINTAVMDKTITKYVLPVSIADGGGEQISNYNAVYYNIVAK